MFLSNLFSKDNFIFEFAPDKNAKPVINVNNLNIKNLDTIEPFSPLIKLRFYN
tara:strand:- start:1014 stop:1172 length:159 start_codon:yes stop_codon:yes gene_type:complete